MENGIDGVFLEGKTVILSPRYFKGDEAERTFTCSGGFGCNPGCIGTAVFGTFVSDGEKARVERYMIASLAPGQK